MPRQATSDARLEQSALSLVCQSGSEFAPRSKLWAVEEKDLEVNRRQPNLTPISRNRDCLHMGSVP